MENLEKNHPLRIVANAFNELATIVKSSNPEIPLKKFSDACSLFSDLLGVLEVAFQFAKLDYVCKVNDLVEASRSIQTIDVMVEYDIGAGRATKIGSHTRNLVMIKRALEMIRVLFEEIIATNADSSLKDAAFKAYNKVFAGHHGQNLQDSAARGMDSLPQRAILLGMIKETEETAKIHMQSYVTASTLVTKYLDNLLLSKNVRISW